MTEITAEEHQALVRRIHKAAGQCNAIERMIDSDATCEQILTQVNAAKSALHRIGQMLLEAHLHQCAREGVASGDATKAFENLSQTIEYFCRIYK